MTDDRLPDSEQTRQEGCHVVADLQYQQLIALRKENHLLRLKMTTDRQRNVARKKEYEEKLDQLQSLLKEAQLRLTEGSDVIHKLQHHLKICQEKLSEKTKFLVAKDQTLYDYQSHTDQLNNLIGQLMDECTVHRFERTMKLRDDQTVDVSVQTSPTVLVQRRSVRFNLDKENCPIDPQYFQPTNHWRR